VIHIYLAPGDSYAGTGPFMTETFTPLSNSSRTNHRRSGISPCPEGPYSIRLHFTIVFTIAASEDDMYFALTKFGII
jgi:hypothetical protein